MSYVIINNSSQNYVTMDYFDVDFSNISMYFVADFEKCSLYIEDQK